MSVASDFADATALAGTGVTTLLGRRRSAAHALTVGCVNDFGTVPQLVDRAAAAHISGVTALRGSLPSRVSVSTFLRSVAPEQRMVSRHLDEHEPDTVSVGDPHLDQAPRLALRRAQDVHVERLKPRMLGADIAHLPPQRDRSGVVQRPAAGHFEVATAEEEDDTRTWRRRTRDTQRARARRCRIAAGAAAR